MQRQHDKRLDRSLKQDMDYAAKHYAAQITSEVPDTPPAPFPPLPFPWQLRSLASALALLHGSGYSTDMGFPLGSVQVKRQDVYQQERAREFKLAKAKERARVQAQEAKDKNSNWLDLF